MARERSRTDVVEEEWDRNKGSIGGRTKAFAPTIPLLAAGDDAANRRIAIADVMATVETAKREVRDSRAIGT